MSPASAFYMTSRDHLRIRFVGSGCHLTPQSLTHWPTAKPMRGWGRWQFTQLTNSTAHTAYEAPEDGPAGRQLTDGSPAIAALAASRSWSQTWRWNDVALLVFTLTIWSDVRRVPGRRVSGSAGRVAVFAGCGQTGHRLWVELNRPFPTFSGTLGWRQVGMGRVLAGGGSYSRRIREQLCLGKRWWDMAECESGHREWERERKGLVWEPNLTSSAYSVKSFIGQMQRWKISIGPEFLSTFLDGFCLACSVVR